MSKRAHNQNRSTQRGSSNDPAIDSLDSFDINCSRCARLDKFLAEVRRDYPEYHARPVPPFGAQRPKLLIVGLAPGMHGANATGRPFTGDYAGILLYQTLYKFGFSSKSTSESAQDKLRLKNCRITNAVKCLPPNNKPVGAEINNCNSYLQRELASLGPGSVVLCLGSIAHNAVLKALQLRQKAFPFGHNRLHQVDGLPWILDSYHCSRYNTQTKRLTTEMFEAVFAQARKLIDHG